MRTIHIIFVFMIKKNNQGVFANTESYMFIEKIKVMLDMFARQEKMCSIYQKQRRMYVEYVKQWQMNL